MTLAAAPAGEHRLYPASFAQERLWVLAQLDGASTAYVVTLGLRLRGELRLDALRAALQGVLDRHDTLRTGFTSLAGRPVQVVRAGLRAHLSTRAPDPADHDPEAAARRLLDDHAQQPFDLAQPPLMRACLVRVGAEDHMLGLSFHHIVVDEWSTGLILGDLADLYAAEVLGQPARPARAPLRYGDYATWQRRSLTPERERELAAYWRDRLAGAPPLLTLPTDRPLPRVQSFRGAWCVDRLPEPDTRRLIEVARAERATLFAALLAGFAALLGRYAGQQDVVVGASAADRSRPELDRTVGFLVDTLALRIDLSGRPSLRELVRRAQDGWLSAHAHRELPFERVVAACAPPRSPAYHPIFQAMLTLQQGPPAEVRMPGLTVTALPPPEAAGSPFHLSLSATRTSDGLILALQYCVDLFRRSTAERFAAHLRELLAGAAADPDRPVAAIPLVTAAQPDTPIPASPADGWPAAGGVVAQVRSRAAAAPDAMAVSVGTGGVTYRQLVARADRIAGALRGVGVRAGDVVGLCLRRGPDLAAAMLGGWHVGAAIMPLDPAAPAPRLEHLLGQSGCAAVLVDADGERAWDALPPGRRPAPVPLRDLPDGPAGPVAACHPDGLAYVLFTSGTTGKPKGAMVSHAGMVNHLRAKLGDLGMTAADVLAQNGPATFDVVVWQYLGPLLLGGRVHVVPDGALADPVELAAELARGGVTVLQAVPSVIRLLLDAPEAAAALERLRWLVPTGDALPAELVRRWFDAHPRVPMLNTYGVAECADDQCHARLTAAPDLAAPPIATIGTPIAGLVAYVLDGELQPCPTGVSGELFLGGVGVGWGYAGQPGLTADRFVPAPRGPGRLYRTGDRVRRLDDGTLEFLGRTDHQVKVRGFRVEPAEVEAALTEHPAVRAAAVVTTGNPTGGHSLVGYAAVGEHRVDPGALRGFLAARLPDYLVPARIVVLDRLPVTGHGKLDRAALPAPDLADPAGPAADGLTGDGVQALVAEVWCAVLGIPRVDPDADFFAAGGDSLLAVALAGRLRAATGAEITLADLLAAPTVRSVASIVRGALRDGAGVAEFAGIPPADRCAPVPASFAQERLWMIEQILPHAGRYTVPIALHFTGEIGDHVLRSALDDLVCRHEVLRTGLVASDGRPVQVIADRASVPFAAHDLSGMPPADALARARDRLDELARRGFELDRPPLLRACALRLGPGDVVLGLALHHVVTDAWSNRLLVRDLVRLVAARRAGRPAALPDLPVQYADFSSWQRSRMSPAYRDRLVSHWTAVLAGAPEISTLPTDRPRPAVPSHRGGRVPVALSAVELSALRGLAREADVTVFMVVLAALATVLARWSGQTDLVIGAAVGARPHPDLANCVGLFVNTLPLRVELSGEPTFRGLLHRVRRTCLAAYAHADLPFEALVEALAPRRTMAHNPVFQVCLSLTGRGGAEAADPDDPPVRPFPAPDTGAAKFDLELLLEESDGLSGVLEYARDLYEPETARRFTGHLHAVLRAVAAGPDRPITRLPLLSDGERRLLSAWSAPAPAVPPAAVATLPGLVAAQVHRTPHAPALHAGGETLSYAQLWTRVCALAARLRAAGVGPGDVVGISLPRGAAEVVAVHAVTVAGAAYLPLDPELPAAVTERMRRVARARMILDGAAATVAGPDAPAVAPAVSPDAPAYVIFTSGTTGTPKGIAVSHRAIANRLGWMQRLIPLSVGDRVLHKTPFGFDVSVWELFWPLTVGACLVVAEPGAHRDPAAMAELVLAERARVVHFVPTMLGPFLDALAGLGTAPDGLAVVSSGEPLPEHLVRRAGEIPGVSLFNLYGPTEAAVDVTWHRCRVGEPVPIGRPADNVVLEVLDQHGQRVPVGAIGELHLGGVQLAQGYLHQPGLTADRFRPDPYRVGRRLYRTGDLGRWRADGTVEYLGRVDRQVKIRGHRVEPGEVEAVIAAQPGVREVVVTAVADGEGTRLAAYLVPAVPGLRTDTLRRAVAAQLPAALVPTWFVIVDALPVGATGKVDTAALPDPRSVPPAAPPGRDAPRGPAERTLARLWAQALGVPEVGRHDNIFELGGDSIRSLQVVSRAARAGLRITPRQCFEHQTVAELAAVAEPLTASAPAGAGPVRLPAGRVDPETLARVVAVLSERDHRAGSEAGDIEEADGGPTG